MSNQSITPAAEALVEFHRTGSTTQTTNHSVLEYDKGGSGKQGGQRAHLNTQGISTKADAEAKQPDFRKTSLTGVRSAGFFSQTVTT